MVRVLLHCSQISFYTANCFYWLSGAQRLSLCEVTGPPYLCDLLCDVLRAVLHLGGAEQLHPGSGR